MLLFVTFLKEKICRCGQISGWQGLGMREVSCDYKGIAWVTEQFCDWDGTLHEAVHVIKLHLTTHTHTHE